MGNKQGGIGDRMKLYEKIEGQRFIPLLPVIARLDGKAFHTWCKGLNKPYDITFIKVMQDVMKTLVEETGALLGYTQSDEISLIFYSADPKSQIFFDGKKQKMNSVLASMCTAYFNEEIAWHAMLNDKPLAFFDCRVWQVPTKYEAANYIIWREQDATRNSILSAGQAQFSHRQLDGLKCPQVQEKLFQERDINWNNYPIFFKRGSYCRNKLKEIPFTDQEIEELPPKHEAHTNPNLVIVRRIVELVEFPIFSTIINREEVIFNGEEAKTEN